MSVAVGQFTALYDGAKLDRPLPMREFAHGSSAGCAGVAADWAWLLEGLAERQSTRGLAAGTTTEWSFEVLPHAVRQTVARSGGSSYSYESWAKHAPLANDTMREFAAVLGTGYSPLFLDPDWTPPTTLADAVPGRWSGGGSASGEYAHRQQLSQRTIYGGSGYYPYDGGSYDVYGYTQGGSFQRRVADDVRRMFWDLGRMHRRRCVVEVTMSVSDGSASTPNQARAAVDSTGYAATMDVCSLAASILDLRVSAAPRSGQAVAGFVPVQAGATLVRADYTSRTVEAWFAADATLGGAVDTSEWTPAKLDAWARSVLSPGTGDAYDAWAAIAPLSAYAIYRQPPVTETCHAYFDLVFPSDYQIFGGAGGWQWTPPELASA